MKKSVVFLSFAILFFSSFVSAVEFDMKSSYDKDETFLAKISGNFLEQPSQSNIIFLKEHTRISIIPIVQNIDGDFYIYAQLLGKTPGNYSIVIEDAKYYQGAELKESDLSENFTISETQADFTISPGFFLTKNNFLIQVQNLADSQIKVSYAFLNDSDNSEEENGGFFSSFFGSTENKKENEILVKSGEIKKIDFNKNYFSPFKIQKIEMRTNTTLYNVPVFINVNKTEINSENKTRIDFEVSELNVTLPLNSKTTRTLYLFNLGSADLENLEIIFSDSLKPYLFLSEKNIPGIAKNESKKIEIFLNSNNTEGIISGQIKVKTQDDFYAYVDITLNFVKNYQPLNESDLSIPLCSEKSGEICGEGQICSGDSEVSRDGNCCLDSCIAESEGSGLTWKIIGWTIIFMIIIFVMWFYFRRYKMARNVVDLLKVARRR